MSSKTFNLSLPEELVKLLDKQAKKEMTSRSDIIRQAALTYLRNNPLEIWNAIAPKTSRLARKAGVYTEQDVVRMTKEIRREIASERAQRQ